LFDENRIPGRTSGGCGRLSEALYWTNPQFLITLKDQDPDDQENMATIIVALMQKYTREKRTQKRGESCEEYIQFRLYRILNERDAAYAKSTGKCLSASQLERCGTSGPYTNQREVTKRFRTPPGSYLIIPSCYDENISGDFLLRIYTENPIGEADCSILHDHGGTIKDCEMYFSTPKSINNEFTSWTSSINGPSRISNDFSRSMNTLTNPHTDFNGFNNARLRPKTSTPLYESKLYSQHALSQVYDKVDTKENKNRYGLHRADSKAELPAAYMTASSTIISRSSSSIITTTAYGGRYVETNYEEITNF
jgi:hypothetical protein